MSLKYLCLYPLPFEEAIRQIQDASGAQFDPAVVEAFSKVINQLPLRSNEESKK
jgi:HD-GYP domain-containing protein (c-di-GMP phosphodiesterase class II)